MTSGVAVGDAVGLGDGSGTGVLVGDAVGLDDAWLGPGVGVVTMTGGPAGVGMVTMTGGPAGVVEGRGVALAVGLGVGCGLVAKGVRVGVGELGAAVGAGDGPGVALGSAVDAALAGDAVTWGGGVSLSSVEAGVVGMASAACEAPNTTEIGALDAPVPERIAWPMVSRFQVQPRSREMGLSHRQAARLPGVRLRATPTR